MTMLVINSRLRSNKVLYLIRQNIGILLPEELSINYTFYGLDLVELAAVYMVRKVIDSHRKLLNYLLIQAIKEDVEDLPRNRPRDRWMSSLEETLRALMKLKEDGRLPALVSDRHSEYTIQSPVYTQDGKIIVKETEEQYSSSESKIEPLIIQVMDEPAQEAVEAPESVEVAERLSEERKTMISVHEDSKSGSDEFSLESLEGESEPEVVVVTRPLVEGESSIVQSISESSFEDAHRESMTIVAPPLQDLIQTKEVAIFADEQLEFSSEQVVHEDLPVISEEVAEIIIHEEANDFDGVLEDD